VVVLGVQGVGGHHRVRQLETVQQRREGGNLVALGSDLSLGQDHAVVVHRRKQLNRRGRCGSRSADHLAIDRDHPSHRPFLRLRLDRGRRSGLQIRADRRVQRVTVHTLQQTPHGCGVRHRPQTGEWIGGEAEDAQHMLRGIRDPVADRDEGASPGQHRRRGCAQQREGRIPQSSRIAGIGDQDQETPQVSNIA
jgi:hypothetical protein